MYRHRFMPVNRQEELDDRLMRDGYSAAIEAAEADGTLDDYLAEAGSSLMLAAVALEMRRRRQADEDPDAQIDQLLRQAGFAELPGLM